MDHFKGVRPAANILADRLAAGNMTAAVASRVAYVQQVFASGGRFTQNGYTGLSAGDPNGPSSVWASATGSDLKFNYIGSGTEGNQYNFVLGADHRFDTITAGVFGGFARTKLDGTGSAYKAEGWSGGVYGSVQMTPEVSLTATVGMANQDVAFDRSLGGFRSFGETDRDQTFGSLALAGMYQIDERVIMAPSAGVVFSRSETDAYLDQAGRPIGSAASNLSLGQVGATFYFPSEGFTPFVGGSLNHHLNKSNTDRTYQVVGGGVIIPVGSVNLVASATTMLSKKFEREHTFSLGVTQRF